MLTLVTDGMRGVRNILFEKAAAGVLASCVSELKPPPQEAQPLLVSLLQVCTVGQEHLFLGSRLGNSFLLKYSTKPLGGGQFSGLK